MADLIQVRSKNRAPYWISRGLFEKYPDDYTEVKAASAKKPAKPRAKTVAKTVAKKPAPPKPTETPATPAE